MIKRVLGLKFPVGTNQVIVMDYVSGCNPKTLYFSGLNVFIKLENGDWLDRFPHSRPYNASDIATLVNLQGGWIFLS